MVENNQYQKFFKNNWHITYSKSLDALWAELINLNMYIEILTRIAKFPFRLLGDLDNHFWDLTFASMAESCVTIMYRSCFDANKDTLTIPSLKNNILQNLAHESEENALKDRLREIDFDKSIEGFRKTLRAHRNNTVAHLNLNFATGLGENDTNLKTITLNDLANARKLINRFYQILCLGHGRAMMLGDYNFLESHYDKRTSIDIDKLLDLVAKHSALLNMPEEQPKVWPVYRERNLSESDLAILNEFRAKFDLPKAG